MRHYQWGKGKWGFIDWAGIWPGYGTDQQGRNLQHGFLMPYGIELRAHKPFALFGALSPDGGTPDSTVMTAEHPVPVYRGFTLDDCAAVKGDNIDIPLTWKEDLRRLRGKQVQLHFDLFNVDLFAAKFCQEKQ